MHSTENTAGVILYKIDSCSAILKQSQKFCHNYIDKSPRTLTVDQSDLHTPTENLLESFQITDGLVKLESEFINCQMQDPPSNPARQILHGLLGRYQYTQYAYFVCMYCLDNVKVDLCKSSCLFFRINNVEYYSCTDVTLPPM